MGGYFDEIAISMPETAVFGKNPSSCFSVRIRSGTLGNELRITGKELEFMVGFWEMQRIMRMELYCDVAGQ